MNTSLVHSGCRRREFDAGLYACRCQGIPVAHVEAGLRSFDRGMPEEINRVLTDQVADLLYTTERTALDNLLREGIPAERVHFAGNVMIDSLVANREYARKPADILKAAGFDAGIVARPKDMPS